MDFLSLCLYPYIVLRRECTMLVVENERRESFATIDRMFFFLLQLTEVAEAEETTEISFRR